LYTKDKLYWLSNTAAYKYGSLPEAALYLTSIGHQTDNPDNGMIKAKKDGEMTKIWK
jgi:hypothetical protein